MKQTQVLLGLPVISIINLTNS